MPGLPAGIPIDFRRLETSKSRLAIDWTFPVYAPDLDVEPSDDGRTTTGRRTTALAREAAFRAVRGDDHRPLLIVRECNHCKGTDDALLSRRLDNERTLLLTRWFRCIKLPNHVLLDDHPFRRLFTAEEPPHLFLCRWDGSEIVAMDGQQSQADLWQAMESRIRADYEGDPARAVRAILKLLNQFDALDSRETELRRQLEEELDDHGDGGSKVRRLRSKLDDLAAARKKLLEREAEVSDLELRPLSDEDRARFEGASESAAAADGGR